LTVETQSRTVGRMVGVAAIGDAWLIETQGGFWPKPGRSAVSGGKRTYLTILESADHALYKMVRYVLLRPLRPELDAKTKTCLAEGELSSRLDEQAI
jgi:hypothetical protein